jgi:rhamnosyltransferase
VAYAEDHLLAQDMLRAGFAKVFVPDAAVIHSHEYSVAGWLRRSFDESRALHEVYGWVEPLGRRAALRVWGNVGADRRWWKARSAGAGREFVMLSGSTAHHAACTAGAVLGSRADRLPRALVRRLSLEQRAS